jgi:phospholipase C
MEWTNAFIARLPFPSQPEYYQYLLTGGPGQASGIPDARINYNGDNASSLPPNPYQLTNPQTYPYDAYAASPVHCFYQMWQQA